MFNASTVMHHNVYVFYMSLLLFTFVNLRSLIMLKVERIAPDVTPQIAASHPGLFCLLT